MFYVLDDSQTTAVVVSGLTLPTLSPGASFRNRNAVLGTHRAYGSSTTCTTPDFVRAVFRQVLLRNTDIGTVRGGWVDSGMCRWVRAGIPPVDPAGHPPNGQGES